MTIYELLKKYADKAITKTEKGKSFENIVRSYFLTDKLYSTQIDEVYLWNDFPYKTQFSKGQDVGIDLVIKTKPIFHGDNSDKSGDSGDSNDSNDSSNSSNSNNTDNHNNRSNFNNRDNGANKIIDSRQEYWAVQCKFYSDKGKVSKSDIDTFLSASGKTFIENDGQEYRRVKFARRYIVCTGNEAWSANAEDAIKNQDIPVFRIFPSDLEEAAVDWDKIDNGLSGGDARLPKTKPFEFQKAALNNAVEYYSDKKNTRGKLIMACGTGKTFTSLLITEKLLFNIDHIVAEGAGGATATTGAGVVGTAGAGVTSGASKATGADASVATGAGASEAVGNGGAMGAGGANGATVATGAEGASGAVGTSSAMGDSGANNANGAGGVAGAKGAGGASEASVATGAGASVATGAGGESVVALGGQAGQDGQRKLVLFLVPSIALLNQSLRAWSNESIKDFDAICVCSDSRASQNEVTSGGITSMVDLARPASTKTEAIKRDMENAKSDFVVVFSTYQSLDVVSAAQGAGALGEFDLIICDEAHRTTGFTTKEDREANGGSNFVRVHDDGFIKGKKRLYMTATPRIYSEKANDNAKEKDVELYSMKNEALYGNEFYKIGFSEAVKKGRLSPYKVIILTVTDKDIPPNVRTIVTSPNSNQSSTGKASDPNNPNGTGNSSNTGKVSGKKAEATDLTREFAAKLAGTLCALSKKFTYEDPTIKKILEQDPAHMKRAIAFLPKIGEFGKDQDFVTTITDEKGIEHEISHSSKGTGSRGASENFEIVASDFKKNLCDNDKIKDLVDLRAAHIDGSMNASEKNSKIQWLRDVPGDTQAPDGSIKRNCRVLCNVRCLSEGVDVPNLDAVIFLSKKNSQLEVIQAVGRVMRKAEGKEFGYIIIPIFVGEKDDAIEALDKNEDYKIVWAVLNALKAHDEAFSNIVDKIGLLNMQAENGVITVVASNPDFSKKSPGGDNGNGGDGGDDGDDKVYTQGKLNLEGAYKIARDYIYSKLVDKVSDKFFLTIWAKEVAKIVQTYIDRINSILNKAEQTVEEGKTLFEGGTADLFQAAKAQKVRDTFNKFLSEMQSNVGKSITRDQAIEMLAEHLITSPIFDALFGVDSGQNVFTKQNTISLIMDEVITALKENAVDKNDSSTQRKLDAFYSSTQERIGNLDNDAAKQKVIKELYENFFKVAFEKQTKKFGIVFTPIEIVDFIIHSVNDVLKSQFNSSLGGAGVNIIDPFTGTGTFITRLLQSSLITKEELPRKYEREIFANEIMLLSYYIAAVNIENTFHYTSGEGTYMPFKNINLTDTFMQYEYNTIWHPTNVIEEPSGQKVWAEFENTNLKENFEEQRAALKRQNTAPITVIIGNPPYSIGQTSANDNAQNEHYPLLEKKISETYAKGSTAQLKNSLYDSYIKAFRWATDRLDAQNGGVVGFVTNAGWLDSLALSGFRECLYSDYTDIYILNLRGSIRGRMGDNAKKEGGNVFDIMTGVAITILVKNLEKTGCTIHYYQTPDYATKEEKFGILNSAKSVLSNNDAINWQIITPNEKGDWINQRNEEFEELLPIAPNDKFDKNANAFFISKLNGVKTDRDAWVYGFSKDDVQNNMQKFISEYERQRAIKVMELDAKKISWTVNLKKDFTNNIKRVYNNNAFTLAMYRPFDKEHLYYDRPFIERPGVWRNIFPTPTADNLVICMHGLSASKDWSVIMTNVIPDLNMMAAGAQCFPLYYYLTAADEKKRYGGFVGKRVEFVAGEGEALEKEKKLVYYKHEGVSDWAMAEVAKKYGSAAGGVTKEDVFYYVYGFLHMPSYREKYAVDLKKSLPRVALPDSVEDFLKIARAGRELAALHLNYDNFEGEEKFSELLATCNKYKIKVLYDGRGEYTVSKMKWRKKWSDLEKAAEGNGWDVSSLRNDLLYNSHVTIEGVPHLAQEYIVNGRSAVDWVIERYRVKTDKDSTLTNDPNKWGAEHGDDGYILKLLLSVIALSLKSIDIIKALPMVEC